MKVQIIRAITGGLLTFATVFCTMCLTSFFSADSNGMADVASQEQTSESLVEAGNADRDQKTKHVTATQVPRRKNVSRPEASWFRGTKAERSRFEPLLRSRLAPELNVNHWTNSKPLSDADREGQIVVVAFWSTWCQPCIESIDFNNQLYQHYKDRGVMMIGVCNSKGSENMGKVVKIKDIQYPVAIDDSGDKTVNDFAVEALPTYFVIDKEGRLRFADIKRSRIDDAVEYLISQD